MGWPAVLQAHPPQNSTQAAKPQAEDGGRRKKNHWKGASPGQKGGRPGEADHEAR